ncbi:DUF5753 domain-containing protein [Streptomyces massasporeus]|uniref:DUF5753 domain-containing protein n=1 Tax=Streptomyces massasporeus TaxID=67324 RepID=UPI0033F955FC
MTASHLPNRFFIALEAEADRVLLRRQHRIHDRDLPLRLKIILDESALRRLVGSPDIMRNQLEHLNTPGTQPHITVQALPHTAGAHPGLSGPFCILRFPGSPEAEMYLERFTSHLHLRKPSEVQHQSPVPAGRGRACGVLPGAATRPGR